MNDDGLTAEEQFVDELRRLGFSVRATAPDAEHFGTRVVVLHRGELRLRLSFERGDQALDIECFNQMYDVHYWRACMEDWPVETMTFREQLAWGRANLDEMPGHAGSRSFLACLRRRIKEDNFRRFGFHPSP